MQLPYRTAQLMPQSDETLVGSPEQARAIIEDLEKKIKDKRRLRHQRAVDLVARATLYIALGDPKMLEAAKDAYDFSKTSETCSLYGAALRHFGRTKESCPLYEQAYKLPHIAGFEVDLAWANTLIFLNRWPESHKIIKSLKKRMVYAGYLPDWDGRPCKELSIISEGGFGDVIQHSRWWPLLRDRVDKVTVYLADYFFEHGMVDLLRRQEWCPEIKRLIETPLDKPATGMFDLSGDFNVTPETVPPPSMFKVDPERVEYFHHRILGEEVIGFCGKARSAEAPLCPDGVYRALTDEQIAKLLEEDVNWLTLDPSNPVIKTWEDTAAIIENLDGVVTVDTGVMHLAASMGKPTYVILSGVVDCKFGMDGDTTSWYPSIRLFKNNDFGFDAAVASLISYLKQ